MGKRKTMTTGAGAPVCDKQNSLTAGPRGQVLMQDLLLIEKMAHFNRKRIPERVVHAKGSGAHGFFEVTSDIAKWTKAKVFVCFSTVSGEKGSGDTERDPRGFAVKFYTQEVKADERYGRGIAEGLGYEGKAILELEVLAGAPK